MSGCLSRLAVESIEKRPLFHFFPAEKFLSAGFFGCSFDCKFCQNFMVSQTTEGDSKYYSASDLCDLAISKKVSGIAFTYNEPTLYSEYICEVGHIAELKTDLELVIKTSGFANKRVIRDLALYANGFNVDIKGDDNEYRRICGGWLEPVLESIELLVEIGVHVEISYLVMPAMVYKAKFHKWLCDWISRLNRNIPVHLLNFYPFHEMSSAKTYSFLELMSVFKIFRKKLPYVYISNCFDNAAVACRNTRCSKCNRVLINRQRVVEIASLECCGQTVVGKFR